MACSNQSCPEEGTTHPLFNLDYQVNEPIFSQGMGKHRLEQRKVKIKISMGGKDHTPREYPLSIFIKTSNYDLILNKWLISPHEVVK